MWNLSLVIWCYAKVLIMKTDITKAFGCQQAISMRELCQNNRWIAPSGPEWFRGGLTLTLSTSVQETTDDDV